MVIGLYIGLWLAGMGIGYLIARIEQRHKDNKTYNQVKKEIDKLME